MRNRQLENFIVAGVAVVGFMTVGKAFLGEIESVEKKGLTLASGLALAGLGFLLIQRFDDAAIKLNQLNV